MTTSVFRMKIRLDEPSYQDRTKVLAAGLRDFAVQIERWQITPDATLETWSVYGGVGANMKQIGHASVWEE